MLLAGKVVVVTGGAQGIGLALCRRFVREGLKGLVLADVDGDGVIRAVDELGGVGVEADVSRESHVRRIVEEAFREFGQIDVFCSNAGIFVRGDENTSDEHWDRMWRIHVKAHVYAARSVLPHMLERGEGYLLQTVSAAGLLNQIGSALYGVTKHAALGFAEWLSIEYGDRGIRVSCICPQGVRTRMLAGDSGEDHSSFLYEGSISAEEVAEAAVKGVEAETFLILPHPEVREYLQRKTSDYDRWLRGMRRLRSKVDRVN